MYAMVYIAPFLCRVHSESNNTAVRFLETVRPLPLAFYALPSSHTLFYHSSATYKGRMIWLTSLALELGGQQRVQAMLAGKGVSVILKDISVKFRRPVTYPDTVRPIDSCLLPILALPNSVPY